MLRLLRIEWNKIAPYRAFRILILLYGISFLALPWSAEHIPFLRNIQQIFEFPAIWFFYYFSGMFLSFALAIIVITITCNEYSYRTFRQHIIDGLGRSDLFAAKMTLMGIGALAITALFTVNGLIAGSVNAFELDRSQMFVRAGFIPGFFLHLMGAMSLAFFLANLLRRTGLAIFAFLLWVFPLELILKGILEGLVKDGGLVSSRLPVWVIYNTNVNFQDSEDPFHLLTQGFIPASLGLENMLMKTAWILIFGGLSWWMIRKRDL